MYGIPKSTLHDHATGKVIAGAHVALPRYLNDEEEEEVVRWLEGCAQVGCAKSVWDVRAVVGAQFCNPLIMAMAGRPMVVRLRTLKPRNATAAWPARDPCRAGTASSQAHAKAAPTTKRCARRTLTFIKGPFASAVQAHEVL